MSKQEIYAWSSLGFTVAIFVYYLVSVLGWPPGVENYSESITSLIWQVIGSMFLVELILDLASSTTIGGIQKDERDIQIESKGFRNAYYFLMVSIITLIVNVLISDYLSEISGETLFFAKSYMIFHILVFILLIANIIRSGTQIFLYEKVSYFE